MVGPEQTAAELHPRHNAARIPLHEVPAQQEGRDGGSVAAIGAEVATDLLLREFREVDALQLPGVLRQPKRNDLQGCLTAPAEYRRTMRSGLQATYLKSRVHEV